jgi:hypothetical protein
VQAYVLSFIDNAHAPAAELFKDDVVRDGLANHASRLPQS